MLETIVRIDLEKLAGLSGTSVYGNFFHIHNSGRILRDYVGGVNTIAAIEARPGNRLSELWVEQKLPFANASLRLGQLTADTEFFFSDQSELFLQSDWATIVATNLPSGGPAYPLSTPGARLKFDLARNASLQFAVYNGDPAGPGPGDQQRRNRHGLNFRLHDSPLAIAELQLPFLATGPADAGLSGVYKLGVWRHFGKFDDQRMRSDGLSLADPASNAPPAARRGNFGVYGVIDQQIFRPAGGKPSDGVWIFARASASPNDRNPVSFYVDGGVVFSGLVPGRPDDKFGFSGIYSRFSNAIRAFDVSLAAFSGQPGPIRDFEASFELTYAAQIAPGWTFQPVATYVVHPSGGQSRNALVVGARSIWRF